MKTSAILKHVQGIDFKTVGPFLVAELGKRLFKKIPVSQHGMEQVSLGQQTESHKHDFPSFYKSSDLDVVCDGETYSLPRQALVLVLPEIGHSWVPKATRGAVGSVDSRHAKQVLA